MYLPLKFDDNNEEVGKLHSMLQKLQYPIQDMANNFNDKTQRAVRSFQNDFGLKVTGIVDENTWDILEKTTADNKQENIEMGISQPQEEMPIREEQGIKLDNYGIKEDVINNNVIGEIGNNIINNEMLDEIAKILMNKG